MASPARHILALCGDDPWVVRREIASAVGRVAPEWRELAVRRFAGEEIDGGELLAEVGTPAFGAPLKVVILQRMQRMGAKATLAEAIRSCPPECFLLLTQDDPKIGATAVAAALEKKKSAAEVRRLYPPDARELSRRLSTRFHEEGIQADGDALSFLSATLEGEPASLESEVEKICATLADQPAGKKFLDAATARELCGAGSEVDPFAFAGHFLERRRKASLEALLDYLRHGGDLIGLNAILIEEAWKTLQYLEYRDSGEREAEIWKNIGAWWNRAQEAIARRARLSSADELRPVTAGVLDLERRMKRESLTSEGADAYRVHLPGLLHLLRLVYHYTR